MPVYPAAAQDATCSSEGCLCRDRVPSYPSDLTDGQWEVLEPQARAVMGELVRAQGRPMVHDLRAMVDGIGYVTRNGIEWRAMPVDFPPWDSVYAFYQRWNERGLPQGIAARLRGRLRAHHGRQAEPTACVIDSQMVKCADTVGAASSGYHGGKKIKGRGRHLIVDVEGWPLALAVAAASVSDKAGAKLVTARLLLLFTTRVDEQDRRHHARDRAADQPPHIPGRQAPLGSRADLRLADEIPASRPRLRAQDRAP